MTNRDEARERMVALIASNPAYLAEVRDEQQAWLAAHLADAILALLSPEQGWLPRGQGEPSACHVLACRFNADCGEWIYGVVASPISAPFTHWMPLPAPPTKGGKR